MSVVMLIGQFSPETLPVSPVILDPLLNFFNSLTALLLIPASPILAIFFAWKSEKLKESTWAGTLVKVIGIGCLIATISLLVLLFLVLPQMCGSAGC